MLFTYIKMHRGQALVPYSPSWNSPIPNDLEWE